MQTLRVHGELKIFVKKNLCMCVREIRYARVRLTPFMCVYAQVWLDNNGQMTVWHVMAVIAGERTVDG